MQDADLTAGLGLGDLEGVGQRQAQEILSRQR
jgi:hypothetical protein